MNNDAHAEPSYASQPVRELVLYFVLAYSISLVLWLPVLLGKGLSPVFLSIGTFGPTISALVTHRVFAHNWRAVRLWTNLRRFLVGLISGTAAVFTAAFTAAFLMTKSGIDRWQWSALLQMVILFGPNLLGGPIGEEAGWRGYALPRLQRHLNPTMSSLILGFLWANWHLPLIVAHVYNVTWWQFVAITIAAAIFLSFGFNKSEGSTICAILIHGFYNVGTGVILNDFIAKAVLGSNAHQHNIVWMSYVGVAVLLCFLTRGRLGYRLDAGRIRVTQTEPFVSAPLSQPERE